MHRQSRSNSSSAANKRNSSKSPRPSRRGSLDSQRSTRSTSLSLSRRPSTDSLARELEAQRRSPTPPPPYSRYPTTISSAVSASVRGPVGQENNDGGSTSASARSARMQVSRDAIESLIGSVPTTSIPPETVLRALEAQAAILQYFKNIVLALLNLVQTGQLPRGILPDSTLGDLVKKLNEELEVSLRVAGRARFGTKLVIPPEMLKFWLKRLLGYYLLVDALVNPASQAARDACLSEPLVMEVLRTSVHIRFDDDI